MRRWTLFGGWLMVVVLATTLTWQIVSAADDQVSQGPIAPLNVAAPAISDTSTTLTSTSLAATTASSAPATSPPTTTGAIGSPATTTTPPPTSTAAATWQTRRVETSGGTVTLRYRSGEVAYQSATPAPGYQVEVEKQGPPEVKVEFESESRKIELEASWQGDDIDVHVSEEDEE